MSRVICKRGPLTPIQSSRNTASYCQFSSGKDELEFASPDTNKNLVKADKGMRIITILREVLHIYIAFHMLVSSSNSVQSD
jgi:hypothetical protein